MTRHRHPRLLPQLPEGESAFSSVNMSAATYAARLAGDPLVARATKRMVERESKWRAERATDPTTPPIAMARSRHQASRRERRRLQREEQANQTA
jgi:hypothetical protein